MNRNLAGWAIKEDEELGRVVEDDLLRKINIPSEQNFIDCISEFDCAFLGQDGVDGTGWIAA